MAAAAPWLPPPAEHRILRFGCRLSPRVQRALAGRPPHIDGQVLAPDMHMFLRLSAASGYRSITDGLPPEQARAKNRRGAEAVSGPRLPIRSVEDLKIPGPAGDLPARLYLSHRAAPEPRPLVIYYHGGGWVVGSIETHDNLCRFIAIHTGAAVLSVGYRLAPEHPFPEPVEDAHAAFRWALEAAPGLGCDADRIAVAGDSAGGNMAAGLCIALREEGERQPTMQALIYPVTDGIGEHRSRELFASGFLLTKADIDLFEDHYMPRRWMLDDPRASVLRADDLSALAPAYITTAGFDVLRDEGEAYAERLRQSGNRVAVRRHPGLIHGFANMTQVSRNARAATLELCGAIAMGLA